MKKFTKKLTNALDSAKRNRVKLNHLPNITTNSVITPTMFKRECAMYDEGILPNEHDLYLGERYV